MLTNKLPIITWLAVQQSGRCAARLSRAAVAFTGLKNSMWCTMVNKKPNYYAKINTNKLPILTWIAVQQNGRCAAGLWRAAVAFTGREKASSSARLTYRCCALSWQRIVCLVIPLVFFSPLLPNSLWIISIVAWKITELCGGQPRLMGKWLMRIRTKFPGSANLLH